MNERDETANFVCEIVFFIPRPCTRLNIIIACKSYISSKLKKNLPYFSAYFSAQSLFYWKVDGNYMRLFLSRNVIWIQVLDAIPSSKHKENFLCFLLHSYKYSLDGLWTSNENSGMIDVCSKVVRLVNTFNFDDSCKSKYSIIQEKKQENSKTLVKSGFFYFGKLFDP